MAWRPVTLFEGFYEINETGDVRSIDRVITRSDGVQQFRRGVLLKPQMIGRTQSYIGYSLSSPQRRMTLGVHHLLYAAFIANIPAGMRVDHKDRNVLNNSLGNLRLASRSQNAANSKISVCNTSGRRGVSWNKRKHKWTAQIKVNQQHIRLGYFSNIDEAAKAYELASIKHFGDFSAHLGGK